MENVTPGNNSGNESEPPETPLAALRTTSFDVDDESATDSDSMAGENDLTTNKKGSAIRNSSSSKMSRYELQSKGGGMSPLPFGTRSQAAVNMQSRMMDAAGMVSRLAMEIEDLRRESEVSHAETERYKSELHSARETFKDLTHKLRVCEDQKEELTMQGKEGIERAVSEIKMKARRTESEKDETIQELQMKLESAVRSLKLVKQEAESVRIAFSSYQEESELKLQKYYEAKASSSNTLGESVILRGKLGAVCSDLNSCRAELTEQRARCRALEIQTKALVEENSKVLRVTELETRCIVLQHEKNSLLEHAQKGSQERSRIDHEMKLLLQSESLAKLKLEEVKKEMKILEVTVAKNLVGSDNELKAKIEKLEIELARQQASKKKYKSLAMESAKKYKVAANLAEAQFETIKEYEIILGKKYA